MKDQIFVKTYSRTLIGTSRVVTALTDTVGVSSCNDAPLVRRGIRIIDMTSVCAVCTYAFASCSD